MESIQKNPDPRDFRYLTLVTGRLYGRSEDYIAAVAKCESPRALYQQLAQDGFPVCRVCGATHVEEDHCKTSKRRRQARRSTDARTELPDAREAIPLFAPVLDTLDGYISDLTVLRETYADERFEAVERYEMSAITDPAKNTTTHGPATLPLGARQSPPHALVALISAYVVEGKPLESLLEVLHPSVKNVKRQQLDDKAAQLRLMAVHVAKLVRGGIVRTGHHTDELEPREQAAVEYITSQLRAGTPEAKIDETLLNRGFSRQEIRRLKKFRIDYPGE
jgi:hypothetical protein